MKTGPGRPKGALNKITRDIRASLRDLAEDNSERVQEWLDRVAESDPAEATRLWLALLRYVTPSLQAAAIAELSPPKSSMDMQRQLTLLSDDELVQIIESGRSLQTGDESPHLARKPACNDIDDLLK